MEEYGGGGGDCLSLISSIWWFFTRPYTRDLVSSSVDSNGGAEGLTNGIIGLAIGWTSRRLIFL